MSKDEGDFAGLRAIEAEAHKLRERWKSWNSAACSATRPTR
jgi:hypothetical protein